MRRVLKRLRAGSGGAEPSIVVTTTRGALVLNLREIDWIEAADYYARLWVGGRSYLLRQSLDQLETRVGAHGFVRAHRKALVRVSGVRALNTTRDGEVHAVLTCGAKVPVSRRRRAAFSAAVRQATA
jgi:two-component system LytT family response regulator